jgi:myosin heavy subunit
MFEKVCGLAIKNSVIVTTRWDVVGNERSVELEQELVAGQQYFKPLCRAGANIFGHDNTRGSAQRVVHKLLNNNPVVLQIQEELETGMTLEQTAAGSQLRADLDAEVSKPRAEIRKVREEMKVKDEAWRDELAKLKNDMTRLTASNEQLKKMPYVPLIISMISGALLVVLLASLAA